MGIIQNGKRYGAPTFKQGSRSVIPWTRTDLTATRYIQPSTLTSRHGLHRCRNSARPSSQSWPAGKAEDEYNKILADHLDGIVLDRKLLRSDFHRYGIEACDVLLKDNTFVHVKLIESSAPASHLITQALVSVETLTYDQEAQAAFRERVDVAGWDGEMYSGKPKRVVLVLARVGKSIDAASLFTFTQVNLWRQVSQLGSQGVEVFVASVEKEKE